MYLHAISFTLLLVTISPVFSQNPGEGLLPKECGKPLSYHTFFGAPTTPANSYPWMAAIFLERTNSEIFYSCAGTLINSRYVLTSASCLASDSSNKLSFIRIGEWDQGTEEDCTTTAFGTLCLPRPIVAGPEEIIIHPSYNTADYSNDIALIRLNISLDFNTINYGLSPICLPPNEFVFKYAAFEKRSFAAGWGDISNSQNSSQILRSVALPVADSHTCSNTYKSQFNDAKQLCVGGVGFDTCYGDGGGPLILPGPSDSSYIQVGIVSFGKTPCSLHPSIYTYVVAYKNWILQNLKP